MRHYPTGVTVITAHAPDVGPIGLTATSFTSVSLDPPLILACIDLESSSHDRITRAEAFCVNILSSGQVDLAARFSTEPGETRFDGVRWRPTPSGAPMLEGAVAWLECEIDGVRAAGDHSIVVGRVLGTSIQGGPALTFYGGSYGSVGP